MSALADSRSNCLRLLGGAAGFVSQANRAANRRAQAREHQYFTLIRTHQ
jgi:hypothetical protein